jgi:hypothetical protein
VDVSPRRAGSFGRLEIVVPFFEAMSILPRALLKVQSAWSIGHGEYSSKKHENKFKNGKAESTICEKTFTFGPCFKA